MGKQTTEQRALADTHDTLTAAIEEIEDADASGLGCDWLKRLGHLAQAGLLIQEARDAVVLQALADRGPVLVGEVLGISRQAVTKRYGTREEARTKIGLGQR